MSVSNALANIRAEMARRRVTQVSMARELGMTQQSLSSRLCGRSELSVSELVAIAQILELPVEHLLAGAA